MSAPGPVAAPVPSREDMAARLEDAARRLRGRRAPHAGGDLAHARRALRRHACCSSARTCSAWGRSSSAAPTTRSRGWRPTALARGVVAYSSGNHAQAVALVARLLGAPAVIVMPSDAPRPKLEATRGYGAEVVFYDAPARSARRWRRGWPPSAGSPWCRPSTTPTSSPAPAPRRRADRGRRAARPAAGAGGRRRAHLGLGAGGGPAAGRSAAASSASSPRRATTSAARSARAASCASRRPTPSPTARARRRVSPLTFELMRRHVDDMVERARRRADRGDALRLGAHEAGGGADRRAGPGRAAHRDGARRGPARGRRSSPAATWTWRAPRAGSRPAEAGGLLDARLRQGLAQDASSRTPVK